MEEKVKIACEYCTAFLSVPREYSGQIACAKCRNEMTVDASTWMPPKTQSITSIQDVQNIAIRLRAIENAIRGVSSTIWMVFVVTPMFLTLFALLIFDIF